MMNEPNGLKGTIPDEIMDYYQRGDEHQRLLSGLNQLEMVRTQELLDRFLPPSPATILDVGGGSGHYACWLARKGYLVHLSDPVSLHLEQARQASSLQPNHPLASIKIGDARRMEHPDGSVDAVLLFGPLYHLTERNDRLKVYQEALRVLQTGGIVMAVGISRFASALDALHSGYLDDPQFMDIINQDLTNGQHRNPTSCASYFTTAYFHHPDELSEEIKTVGLQHIKTLAVEGTGWVTKDFDQCWQDKECRAQLLAIVRRLEDEPTLLGMSGHVMVIGRKI
jgi:ubiquinone/menaquinone biosynthesis C-methylase UbiE